MMKQGIWTKEEHDRFLDAIKIYPQGPWRVISKHIGTRSVRQVQTHAQKCHEKIQRRMRGMRKDRKTWARTEHRIDEEILESCRRSEGFGLPTSSVLQKVPLDPVSVSFEELLKQAAGDATPRSPVGVEGVEPLELSFGSFTVKQEQMEFKLDNWDATFDFEGELPSLSESLDILIERFSD